MRIVELSELKRTRTEVTPALKYEFFTKGKPWSREHIRAMNRLGYIRIAANSSIAGNFHNTDCHVGPKRLTRILLDRGGNNHWPSLFNELSGLERQRVDD